MQLLKSNINDSILKESLSLFYLNGFEKTTTREIAQKVKISVSNLYKYFLNKEAIFDAIIKDYYSRYRNMLSQFVSHEEDDTFDENRIALVTEFINKGIAGHHKEFVILMDKSDETKYSEFKNEVIKILEEHIRESCKEDFKEEYIITIFARNFFYGIVEIAKSYTDDKYLYQNIYLLVKYHLTGISILF